MTPLPEWLLITLSVAAVATATQHAVSSPHASPGAAEIDGIAGATIFFGHQSVGMNVLDGLKALASEQRVALRIVERATAAGIEPGTVAHTFIGRNGDPLGKLDAFEAALRASKSADAGPDIALVKFCFVDFDASTDVAALFARYQTMMSRLEADHPRTVFVHVTVPLTTAEHGPKDFLKRLLGRTTSSAVNARREAFSNLLRAAYAGREPLYDLARVESTAPDGHVESGTWAGRAVPALVPAYTDDGAHLNAAGARRAANELVSVLARAQPSR